RSPHLAGLVSPRHPGLARPRGPRRPTGPGPAKDGKRGEACKEGRRRAAELLPLLPALRGRGGRRNTRWWWSRGSLTASGPGATLSCAPTSQTGPTCPPARATTPAGAQLARDDTGEVGFRSLRFCRGLGWVVRRRMTA